MSKPINQKTSLFDLVDKHIELSKVMTEKILQITEEQGSIYKRIDFIYKHLNNIYTLLITITVGIFIILNAKGIAHFFVFLWTHVSAESQRTLINSLIQVPVGLFVAVIGGFLVYRWQKRHDK